MATSGQQIPEAGELRLDQLEIGKVYRVAYFGRRLLYNGKPVVPGEPHQLIDQFLGVFNGGDVLPENVRFTIVARGTLPNENIGDTVAFPNDPNPTNNFYYRFFQTAQDRIVKPFEQETLKQVLANIQRKGADPLYPNATHGIDPAAAHRLSDGWFAPNVKPPKKSGGRKYKTRQTKLRRKNRTKKNRRRRHN